MVFSSFVFLFLFLPVFLAIYFVVPNRSRNLVALIGSYLFYSWGAPTIVLWLFVSSVFDYFLCRRFRGVHRARWFALGIVGNISLLLYFKYANFFVQQLSFVLSLVGVEPIEWVAILLPAGISFFTFHKISYLTDVYTGRTERAHTLVDYLLYVAFFPQLIAGPILRYHDIADQIVERMHSMDDVFYGAARFCLGLGKKILIADALGKVANNVFETPAAELTSFYAWAGVLSYAFQIYFDFSAYSDMAIGLARVMGFRFLENFNMPYISQTITEFWRRWHISLSNWMKEYLYVPLGGNRKGVARTYANLVIVFLISGLWHGASWTFILWGVYHGMFLIADRVFWARVSEKLPAFVNVVLTFLVVRVGWVLFRSASLAQAGDLLTLMTEFSSLGSPLPNSFSAAFMSNREVVMFWVACLLCFVPASESCRRVLLKIWSARSEATRTSLIAGCSFTLFILSVVTLSGTDFSPFLYFEF